MLAKLATFTDFDTLNTARVSTGATLGILRPTRIVGLDITPVDNPDWTKEELQKLVQYQQQAGLFDDDDAREITTPRKLPFSFHYNYECRSEEPTYELQSLMRISYAVFCLQKTIIENTIIDPLCSTTHTDLLYNSLNE